ncbi:hypothetical protein [Duganella aceris]|uniref:Uncharacterized protein n=1 Tax=Duganella aceris TaxID=2703883 RepID=A0ABX0FDS4_9BURK|nr:hypothetical protein [Duganella aceris]NGZ82893.1 hypothetical protein [Duganella aceris]
MKKYLTAGLLAACLTAPALAVNSKLIAKSPDEPVHRRAIVLCIAVLVGLHAYSRRPKLAERVMGAYVR